MRTLPLLFILTACDGGWELDERPVDYQPPPGAGGLEIVGPSAVRAGDATTWWVRSVDLPIGIDVALGWGGQQGPGRCPYRRLVGGTLCLDIDNPARHFATRTTIDDPERPGSGLAVFDVPAPATMRPEIFLQAISIDGASSATSNVQPVDVCPPSCDPVVLQPDDSDVQDIWTTSVFSYTGAGGGPGGGRDDEELRVGGWGDYYYSLVKFDLDAAPVQATQVMLELNVARHQGTAAPGLLIDQVTSSWDWKASGCGSDLLRLWWCDRPSNTPLMGSTMASPAPGAWLSIDITDLFNDWQAGVVANEGIQIRPDSISNRFVMFHSSAAADPLVRPRLVITP